jgi:hypothetical protein
MSFFPDLQLASNAMLSCHLEITLTPQNHVQVHYISYMLLAQQRREKKKIKSTSSKDGFQANSTHHTTKLRRTLFFFWQSILPFLTNSTLSTSYFLVVTQDIFQAFSSNCLACYKTLTHISFKNII